MPSTMSTRTTSASSLLTIQWAQVAPTLPAPTTVTLLRRGIFVPPGLPRSHVGDDGLTELARADQLGAGHQALEVVGDGLGGDGPLHAAVDALRRLVPAHVLERQRAAQDDRPGVHLVLPGVFGRGAVGRLEHRRAVADVGARRDAEPADLGGRRVAEVVAVEVGGRDDRILVGAEE